MEITNKEKAKEIAEIYSSCYGYGLNCDSSVDCYQSAMPMAKWKDEQSKVIINYLKQWARGWLIEQLTAFAVHLNKRGAFRDDLCMDFEHEAQSFIELQKPKKL